MLHRTQHITHNISCHDDFLLPLSFLFQSLSKNFKSEDFAKSVESSMAGKGDTMASEILGIQIVYKTY